jgi:hypothetical protein
VNRETHTHTHTQRERERHYFSKRPKAACVWLQEDASESQPIHATFQEQVQQLAGASEEYQREGVSFLRALLHPDPAKRMTAQGALQHPFLSMDFLSVSPASMPPELEAPEIILETTFQHMMWDVCVAMNQKPVLEEDEDEDDGEDPEDEDLFF